MPAKGSYLVRGPDGRMSTVIAFSTRGAVNIWRSLRQNRKKAGAVSAKLRGSRDNWDEFNVKATASK